MKISRSYVDPISASMMKTMMKMRRCSGTPGLELSEGVTVGLEILPDQPWTVRMRTIWTALQAVTDDYQQAIDYGVKILKFDGWTLTAGRLKTPPWMTDAVEIVFEDLPLEFRWLRDCASATKSKSKGATVLDISLR